MTSDDLTPSEVRRAQAQQRIRTGVIGLWIVGAISVVALVTGIITGWHVGGAIGGALAFGLLSAQHLYEGRKELALTQRERLEEEAGGAGPAAD